MYGKMALIIKVIGRETHRTVLDSSSGKMDGVMSDTLVKVNLMAMGCISTRTGQSIEVSSEMTKKMDTGSIHGKMARNLQATGKMDK